MSISIPSIAILSDIYIYIKSIFINPYLYVYKYFHANINTTVGYSHLNRSEAYLTHLVNWLSSLISKQLMIQLSDLQNKYGTL